MEDAPLPLDALPSDEAFPGAEWLCLDCAFAGSYEQAEAHRMQRPHRRFTPARTKTGRVITSAEVDRWAHRAEWRTP